MIIQCFIICSHVLSLFRDLFVTANVKGLKGVQYFDLHRGPIPLTFDAPKRIPPLIRRGLFSAHRQSLLRYAQNSGTPSLYVSTWPISIYLEEKTNGSRNWYWSIIMIYCNLKFRLPFGTAPGSQQPNNCWRNTRPVSPESGPVEGKMVAACTHWS